MIGFSYLSTLFGITALVAGTTNAGPVRHEKDFHFKHGLERDDCPAADGSKYSVSGKTFGILCGWDTKARGHHWGPYYHLDFTGCIEKCAEKPGCTVATYTGTCYLKKHAKGLGYVRGKSPKDMTAIKLKDKHEKGKHGGHKNEHPGGRHEHPGHHEHTHAGHMAHHTGHGPHKPHHTAHKLHHTAHGPHHPHTSHKNPPAPTSNTDGMIGTVVGTGGGFIGQSTIPHSG